MRRGRKALETLKSKLVRLQYKLRRSAQVVFCNRTFFVVTARKIYKHHREEKRKKQQARIYKGGNKGMQKRDIFEELARCVGCHYISDLRSPPYNRDAKETFRRYFCPENYSLKELAALYRYLYKTERTFESHTEAREAFGLKMENIPKIGGGRSPLKKTLHKIKRKEEENENDSIQTKRKNGFVSCG